MDDNSAYIDKITEMTGKSFNEISEIYQKSGIKKHSEVRQMFMDSLNLSYGYANTLVHLVSKTDSQSLSQDKTMTEILDGIYIGKKEIFRPIHQLIMNRIKEFGEFEISPKKTYLSLRCKKQFATLGPKTNTRMEIGINGKDIQGDERLIEQPKGSMCKYIVKITSANDFDDTVVQWLEEAYKQAL